MKALYSVLRADEGRVSLSLLIIPGILATLIFQVSLKLVLFCSSRLVEYSFSHLFKIYVSLFFTFFILL